MKRISFASSHGSVQTIHFLKQRVLHDQHTGDHHTDIDIKTGRRAGKQAGRQIDRQSDKEAHVCIYIYVCVCIWLKTSKILSTHNKSMDKAMNI